MANRGFGYRTLTGTAQPAFGCPLTSTITVLTPDLYTGTTDPRSNPSSSTASVGSTFALFFQKGDRVIIGPGTGAVATQVWDSGKIVSVNPSTGALVIQGLTASHAANEWIILCVACAELHIQPGGSNSGSIFVGPDSTVSVTSPTLYREINASYGALDLGLSASGNVWETQGYWIQGTSANTFLSGIVTI